MHSLIWPVPQSQQVWALHVACVVRPVHELQILEQAKDAEVAHLYSGMFVEESSQKPMPPEMADISEEDSSRPTTPQTEKAAATTSAIPAVLEKLILVIELLPSRGQRKANKTDCA